MLTFGHVGFTHSVRQVNHSFGLGKHLKLSPILRKEDDFENSVCGVSSDSDYFLKKLKQKNQKKRRHVHVLKILISLNTDKCTIILHPLKVRSGHYHEHGTTE